MSNCGIMLGTNVFNHLLDGEVDLEILIKYCDEIFITHIQEDELNSTKDQLRKKNLFNTLKKVEPRKIATESAIWDVSRWDEAKWGTAGYHEQIKSALDIEKCNVNNTQDALIGETCIVNGYTLITNDKNLADAVANLGGKTKDFRVKTNTLRQ